jgi:hypothetical protein
MIKAAIPDGPRKQLDARTWDSTAVLLDAARPSRPRRESFPT